MNEVVLVTGAAKGIGFEIAQRFLAEGARVAVNDCLEEQLKESVEQLSLRTSRNLSQGDLQQVLSPAVRQPLQARPGQAPDGLSGDSCAPTSDRVMGIAADVSSAYQVNQMLELVLRQWGKLDILVNNAGIYPSHPFLEMDEDEWDRVMDVNAKGMFLVSQSAARKMVEGGIRGHIINISSGSYHVAREGSAHYCASKAAEIMLTKVMAMELARYGIRVNAVAPGFIEVDSMQVNPSYAGATLNQIPCGRWGRPTDIADVVYHLASMDTDYITGAVIAVDGGLALGRYGIPRS
jgi:3-oxoacyl-[acyl-carrier protein] reductase